MDLAEPKKRTLRLLYNTIGSLRYHNGDGGENVT